MPHFRECKVSWLLKDMILFYLQKDKLNEFPSKRRKPCQPAQLLESASVSLILTINGGCKREGISRFSTNPVFLRESIVEARYCD